MSILDEVVTGLIVVGVAGGLATLIQWATALPSVRCRLLTLPTSWPFVRTLTRPERRRLRAVLVRVADDGDGAGSSAVLSIISATREKSWQQNAEVAVDVSERMLRWTGTLLVELRFPEEVRRIRSFLRGALSDATVLGEYRPADAADATPAFSQFVTALSGAVVLGDAAETRARVFDHVSVVDRRPDVTHVAARCECAKVLGPGDYDGPVLDVVSVDRVSHPSSPLFGLLMQTSGTCYAATESFVTGHGCKHIPLGAHLPELQQFAMRRSADRWGTWSKEGRSGHRTNLLTAYALIRTSDDRLVLAQRSARTRNGLDTLSLSAGGVVEFDDHGPRRYDVDASGAPDVRAAVIRETREELGIELIDESVRAMCAVLVNSRGPDRTGRPEGQVLTTVIFAASSDLSFDEVVDAQLSRSDPATGSFEVAHLECVELGNDPELLAMWLAGNAERVDQHLVVGLAYALMLRFGRERTIAALVDAHPDAPWWSPGDPSLEPRTAFPVGELVGGSTRLLLKTAHPAWGSTITSAESH